MEHRYKLVYEDENKFMGLLKSLKVYNAKAYKDFIFKYLPEIKQGNFSSDVDGKVYTQYLTADKVFEFVYGKVCVKYKVKKDVITLISVEPQKFLDQGRRCILDTYKGCPVVSPRDKFAVDYFYVTHS